MLSSVVRLCTVFIYHHDMYHLYAELSTELESKSGERLATLHMRLQQEAEKIRKWKNATEVEIKHKVCKMSVTET